MFKTVRARITVCFGGGITILFLLFGITGYQVLCDYLVEMQQQNQERLAESLCSSISFFRQNCESEIEKLADHEALTSLSPFIWEEENRQLELETWMKEFAAEHEFIHNMYLINQQYEVVGTGSAKKVRTYLIDRISTAERYDGKIVWDSGYDTSSMMAFEKFHFPGAEDKAAYLFIQIDNSQILDLFNKFRLQNSQRFSLKGIMNGFEVTEQGFFYNYYDNYAELLHTEIPIGDWNLRTWSDKHLILGPAKELFRKMINVLLAALLAAAVISVWLAAKLTKPIKSMKESMERYGKGDFSAKVEATGKDEIGSLANLLNQMSEQISELFERVKKEEEQSRRLELQTMVYQINPHFLYNTLDSVNMLARKSGDNKVAELVTDLSRLFRLGLNQGRDMISVRDELMHVMYYLKIQKIRFDDQLFWEIEAEPDIMDYEITKFILQPIAENAIYHGVKSKEEPGYLKITARAEGEYLIFTVEDTGNGMDTKSLQKLKLRINSEQTARRDERGFGMWNVNQRIRLCYGGDCGIEVESVESRGTKVILRVLSSPAGK